jgi:hypothetical protein
MPKYNINNNFCEIDYDKGQEEVRSEIITIGDTINSTVSAKVTLDKSGKIVRVKIKHPGE